MQQNPKKKSSGLGPLKGLLGRLWIQFARHLGGCGWYVYPFLLEKCDLVISIPYVLKLLLLRLWATKWEALGCKFLPEQPKAASDRQGREIAQCWRYGNCSGAVASWTETTSSQRLKAICQTLA